MRSQNLVGYFTLHNDMIHLFKNQKSKHKWELDDDLEYFPAIKVHFFGVDDRFREKGYGEYLLTQVFRISIALSRNTGCNFIVLESLHSETSFYEKYGFRRKSKGILFDDMIINIKDLL
ncbi:Acetyltransferase (GNAT) family protein [compost metagenome]